MATLSRRITTYSDGSYEVENFETQLPSILFTHRVSFDWERDDWTGTVTRSGMPCVFRCGELIDNDYGHYVELTKEWQFFWFDLCCKSYYGKYHEELTSAQYSWLAQKWTAVGGDDKAFTNQHGLDYFRNYVLNTGIGKQNPAIYTLICGGASTKPLSIVKNNRGMLMAEIPSFDGTKPPPDVRTIDIKTDPRIFMANSITSKEIIVDGRKTYAINPFPQFQKNYAPQDVPVPLVSNEPIYYPVKYLVKWEGNVKFNPYNLPRNTFLNYP
jgi:hypothetical protein